MAIPSLVQDLFVAVVPGGGQRTARRNAWAAMSADAARARALQEAQAAMAAAVARHERSRTGT